MINPYKILGIQEGASKEEIQKAYRELVKKYHPDQYGNNPLRDLAEDKMREINEAYTQLMKNNDNNSYNYSSYNSDYSNYNSIRMDINNGNFASAEQKLNNMSIRNAEWNYLMGLINFKKGWYDSAYNYIQTACSMDPTNIEYRNTFNRINHMNDFYRQPYNNRGNSDLCRICTTLYCMDCCCECCGGDLISCC